METENQKYTSLKWAYNKTHKKPLSNDEVNELKKSTDSLYKQLQFTPNEAKTQSFEQSIIEGQENKQPQQLLLSNRNFLKANHTDKFQLHSNNSKKEQIKDTKLIGLTYKLKKPSTPTFNTKSSLNFLKNRKAQILINQANGITFNNLQLMRKSKSKSSEKSQILKICKEKSPILNNFKDTSINQHLKYLTDLKRNSQNSYLNKARHARSVSNLTKIEGAVNGAFSKENYYFENSIRKGGFSNQNMRAKSVNNSLKSSRAHSIQPFEDEDMLNLSQSKSNLLNSINQKLTESKLLRNLEQVEKQRKDKVQREKQNNLFKRLNNLEMILTQMQQKPNKIKENKAQEFTKDSIKPSKNSQIIEMLQNQIKCLNQQLNKLQQKYSQKNAEQPKKQKIIQVRPNSKLNNLNNSNCHNRNNSHSYFNNAPMERIHKENQKSSHLALNLRPLQNSLPKNHYRTDNGTTIRKSPIKVTFQYQNATKSQIALNYQNFTHTQQINQKQLYVAQKNPIFINIPPSDQNNYQSLLAHQNITNSKMQPSFKNYQVSQQPLSYQTINFNNNLHSNHFNPNQNYNFKNKHPLQTKKYSPLKNTSLNSAHHPQNVYYTTFRQF